MKVYVVIRIDNELLGVFSDIEKAKRVISAEEEDVCSIEEFIIDEPEYHSYIQESM